MYVEIHCPHADQALPNALTCVHGVPIQGLFQDFASEGANVKCQILGGANANPRRGNLRKSQFLGVGGGGGGGEGSTPCPHPPKYTLPLSKDCQHTPKNNIAHCICWKGQGPGYSRRT